MPRRNQRPLPYEPLDFVEQAVAKHGPPVTYDDWTKPKQTIRPRKRAS